MEYVFPQRQQVPYIQLDLEETTERMVSRELGLGEGGAGGRPPSHSDKPGHSRVGWGGDGAEPR